LAFVITKLKQFADEYLCEAHEIENERISLEDAVGEFLASRKKRIPPKLKARREKLNQSEAMLRFRAEGFPGSIEAMLSDRHLPGMDAWLEEHARRRERDSQDAEERIHSAASHSDLGFHSDFGTLRATPDRHSPLWLLIRRTTEMENEEIDRWVLRLVRGEKSKLPDGLGEWLERNSDELLGNALRRLVRLNSRQAKDYLLRTWRIRLSHTTIEDRMKAGLRVQQRGAV